MKIKLIKAWNMNSPGTELNPGLDGVAMSLIERGYAVLIEEPQPKTDKKKLKIQEPELPQRGE